MENTLRLNFLGESISREDFLNAVKEQIFTFVGFETKSWNIFTMMVIEMLKNIYDHSENKGYAHFTKTQNTIIFEIKNNTDTTFNYQKYMEIGLSSKETKENYGIGLGVIDELSKQLDIKLKIDQTKGLCYKGIWNHSG